MMQPSTRSARWQTQAVSLLQAAQRAIHRSGPDVSMDQIAAEAGITKPILYRHFGDRRGLARALRDFVFVTQGEDLGPDAKRAARERIASYYPVVDDVESFRRLLVAWGGGFQMFVEFNRSVYGFLRAEGVLGDTWRDPESGGSDPLIESFSRSFHEIFRDRGVDATRAELWAHGLRGMIKEVVDWRVKTQSCDRFEIERQIDLLVRAALVGIEHSLPPPKRSRREKTTRGTPPTSKGKTRKKAAAKGRTRSER